MKLLPVSLFALAAGALTATAEPVSFDFKDAKGVNHAVFKLDAPLESISGTANGVSGTVMFDPAKPAAFTGKLVIATGSLMVGNEMMTKHMIGADWLDAAAHPEISFEVGTIKNAKTEGTVTTADVTGKFSLKGVTKELTVPVKLTYLKDKLKSRGGPKDGDLLVVRANFTVKRSDFNIQPGRNEDKVSNDIEINLAVAGAAPRG